MSTINFISVNDSMPTRIGKESKTNIDVVYTNNVNLVEKFGVFDFPDSDHQFVAGMLNLKSPKINKVSITSRCLNERVISSIKDKVNSLPFDHIDLFSNTDDKWYMFKKIFMDLIDSIAPVKTIRLKENILPWVDTEMRNWFNQRDKLLILANESSESRISPEWDKYREIRNLCKSKLREKMKLYYEDKTAPNFKSSRKFWDFYKSVVKTKKSKSSHPISVIDQDGNKCFDDKSISDVFNQHFSNLSANLQVNDQESEEFIDQTFTKLKLSNKIRVPESNFDFKQTNPDEVLSIISQIDSSSSAGISAIPAKIIKECAASLALPLSKLFNHCIITNTIPVEWKQAIVTPLLKKGDPDKCDNYRGISVLSPISKVFEKILASRVLDHFVSNSLFTNKQHGFRPGFSCETAIQSLLDQWKKLIDEKNIIIVLFIDFSKAFDLVNSELLLRRLFHYGFSTNALNLMRNYFSMRTQSTKIVNSLSDPLPIDLGVPQGSILGPILFLIFINDMSFCTEFHNILFADDTTLYEANTNKQTVISVFRAKFKVIYDWITFNQMSLNWDKTKIMYLTKQRDDIQFKEDVGTVFLDRFCDKTWKKIEVVTEFKLLGVTIDRSLTFGNYLKELRSRVHTRLFSIKNIFFLPFNVKLQFFKTFILPHFDYCNSLIVYFTDSVINQIEKLYNFCIFKLLKIDLKPMTLDEQKSRLNVYNLLPYRYRSFLRFCIFSRQIANKKILHQFHELLSPIKHRLRNNENIYLEPNSRTIAGSRRLSIILPKFINKIVRYSYLISGSDFKTFILFNISDFYNKFLSLRVNLSTGASADLTEDDSFFIE